MNLKRQLLLVSLLTLMLPWAGCEFIRETESALRAGQQQMLAGTARAIAGTLSQYREEFPQPDDDFTTGDRLYLHELESRPAIDGYFDDWSLSTDSLRTLRGTDGPIRVALGAHQSAIFLFIEVQDRNVVYQGGTHHDFVSLVSASPPYLRDIIDFAAEAPGRMLSRRRTEFGFGPEATIDARWQDFPGGYRIEARIPAGLLATHLGIVVTNTASPERPGTRSASFGGNDPGPVARRAPELEALAADLVQPDMRLTVTDAAGWRIATAGTLGVAAPSGGGSPFARRVYGLLVERGTAATLAEPDPLGREHQPYVSAALGGDEAGSWFRSASGGRAIVAVAAPVFSGSEPIGAVILQQNTNAILSLTNDGLARLINVTLLTALVVGGVLLGYATWLSRRIRALSRAAEDALENERLSAALPSALAGDEIGDLSRSFSYVLRQLGEYNDYLRSLASKLSHELRTPLAIVTSSLENLEHEPLNEASLGYTERARDGAERLRRILNAMSEASRVEELMAHGEPERFDLRAMLEATTAAYRDAYPERAFRFDCNLESAEANGSPELLIQMLDKLVDNAADFSAAGDTIVLSLEKGDSDLILSVTNPGPPLPERMRAQLFDSMVSMRSGENTRHLGLGLYVAKLIAEGHGGRIDAQNVEEGVRFSAWIPAPDRLKA